MTKVIVTCPTDGDITRHVDDVVVDPGLGVVAFTCPVCEDLVRHRPTGPAAGALIGRVVRSGGAVATLQPARRSEVCDGRPLTSIEAFELHRRLGAPGAVEAAVEALR